MDIYICPVIQKSDNIVIIDSPSDYLSFFAVQWMLRSNFSLKLSLNTWNFSRILNCSPRFFPFNVIYVHRQTNLNVFVRTSVRFT